MTTKPARAIKQGHVSRQNKTKQPTINENRQKSSLFSSQQNVLLDSADCSEGDWHRDRDEGLKDTKAWQVGD